MNNNLMSRNRTARQQKNQVNKINNSHPKAKLIYLLRDVASDKQKLRETIINNEQGELDIEAQIKLLERLIQEQHDKKEYKKKEAEDYRQYLFELETRKYTVDSPLSIRNMMKHRVTNQDPGSGQFDELVPEFSSQCYADMMSEDKSSFSMRPLPKRNPKVNDDHEDALKDMLNSMAGYNYGSPDEFLKKVNTEIDRMHEYMSKRKGIVIEEISEELAKFRQKRDVVDKDCESSLPGKNLPDENNNVVVEKQEKGASGVDLAMFKMRQKMENKKYEMEDSEWENNAKLRGYTVEDVQQYNLEMIEDILEIIKASKDLVAASAEFQRLSQKANRKMEKQVKEAKNKGMLDDALEVVRSIGALMMVASDAIDGKISKEYLMVSANHVKERCVSAVIRNIGHDKFKPLTEASKKLQALTNGLSEKASQAKHFDESKTALKVKRGFNIDKSGKYSLQDVFRLHEIINAKAIEMDKVAEEMRNFRTETNSLEAKSEQMELDVIRKMEGDPARDPNSTENVCDTLMSGLSAEVQFELDLKTRIMQAEIVLEKAKEKLVQVEIMNPMKSGMKIK